MAAPSYNDLITIIAQAQQLAGSKLPDQTYNTDQASALLASVDAVTSAAQAFVLSASIEATTKGAADMASQLQQLADYIVGVGGAQLAPYRTAVALAVVGGLPTVTFTKPANSALDVTDSPSGTREAAIAAGLPAAPDLRGVILYLLDRYSASVGAVHALGVVMAPGPITILFVGIKRLIDTITNVAKAISYLIPALIYGTAIIGAGIGAYFLIRWVRSSKADRREAREAHAAERKRVQAPYRASPSRYSAA